MIFIVLHTDPQVQKYGLFRDNIASHYKFTAKAARHAFVFLVAIPVSLTYVAYKYQNLNYIAKRRTEPIHEEYVPRK
ncbi:hypothetical protein B5S33_g240 [[Candida] boidinii]|nr:hypothetical protein B5S30_g970 [[Candida] boidinii]OWB81621.1 hypothetical protein B5S33_g240 [[Candida] boidinii]